VTERSWTAIVFACLANFVVFVVVAIMLGGDALGGKTEGGRYFLANHGRLTEVSATAFAYSRYHALSIFITHPIAFVAAWRGRATRTRRA
jgi:hypothetical protein